MDVQLRRACLWIAAFAASISLASALFAPVRIILFPTTIFVGGTAALLFLRMLFSRSYRQGLDAANREMRGDDPWPGRAKKFSDPEWGLFGSRAGSPALVWLRAVFVFGILPLAFLYNWIGTQVVLLWFAGAIVATELSIMHLALSQPRQIKHGPSAVGVHDLE